MKRLLAPALFLILILCLCIPISAHSGKTDAAGGHYDSSTGEYHYHHGYPAHSHDNGCPYDYDDKTDHSYGYYPNSNSSSSSHTNSSGGGEFVIMAIAILVVVGIVVAWFIWVVNNSDSSNSTPSPPPQAATQSKPTTATVKPTPTSKDPNVSKLEAEISKLKSEKSELEASLKTAQRFRDSHWSQLTALKKEHEKYVKDTEAELKKAKEAATPVSVAENNRLQDLVIKLQLDVQRLEKAAKESEAKHTKEKEKYEKEISRLKTTPAVSTPSPNEISELNSKIVRLEHINKSHEDTISSLKKDLIKLRNETHFAAPMAEEERRRYDEKIEKLKEELKEPTYFKNLFTSSFRKLEKEGDSLFYNYPSVHDFLRQVTDKRFHRAMIEDISISGKIQISASIRSSETFYNTSLQSCNCVDYQRTHAPCKHMLYLAYHSGVLLIHQEDAKKSIKTYLDKLKNTPVPKK